MRSLLRALGYDPEIVDGLSREDARFFHQAALASLLAALVVAVGTGYGGWLTLGALAAPALAIAGALFLLNLLRMHHAGSGYPLHLPLEDIAHWRPGATASLVLFLLGLLLAQPVAFLVRRPSLDAQVTAHFSEQRAVRLQLGIDSPTAPADGLILRAHLAWQAPLPTGALVGLFSLLIALPAVLRRVRATAVRSYESERWIRERMFVDDEYAAAQEAVSDMLQEVPGFVPPLQNHYADPPYNTRPLIYGLDPSVFIEDGIKLTRPSTVDGDAVFLSESPLPVEARVTPPIPAAVAPVIPIASKPAPVIAAQASRAHAPDSEEVGAQLPTWDDPAHDTDSEAPAPAFFEVGRAQARRAREHMEVTAPLIARYTGRPEAEVRALLQAAPDDARLHRLFPEWKRLPTILLKDAGFALDFGLAPVLAIIVQRPLADVERRLRAAPRDKRLPGVFAPELARRLLKRARAP